MSLLISEIMAVRSLQKDLRDQPVSEETARAIQQIHECLRGGSDAPGWHRVDWRSRAAGARPQGGAGAPYRGFNSKSNIAINRPVPISRPPPTKYVSRFKAATETIDDTILNTIILGKLNKFSPANYDEIKGFMCQILDSGEKDFLREFMKLVFQKATTEEIFCPLYAKLLSELSNKYTILLDEMIILYKEYMAIFGEVEEATAADYDEFVVRTTQRKYRLGYSQFLAELVKHNVLDRDLLIQTIRMIVVQIPKVALSAEYIKVGEEYTDCLLKIICALAESKATAICTICSSIKEEVSPQIQPYTIKATDSKLSMKARFTLLDVYERLQKK